MKAILLVLILITISIKSSSSASSGFFQTNTSGKAGLYVPYVPTGLNLTNRESLVFMVKGIEIWMLAFIRTPGNYTNNMFELILSSYSKNSGLRNVSNAFYLVARMAAGNLTKQGLEPAWAWVSWANGTFACGSGRFVGRSYAFFHPDNTPVRHTTTVDVTSVGNPAEWWIPYDQDLYTEGIQPLEVINTAVPKTVPPDPVHCDPYVNFPGSPGVKQTVNVQTLMDGRNAIAFKVDSYSDLTAVYLAKGTTEYQFTKMPYNTNINRKSVNLAFVVNVPLPPGVAGIASSSYWVSWDYPTLAMGVGEQVGKNLLIMTNDSSLVSFDNVTLVLNGSLNVVIGYYFGLNALSRNSDPYTRTMHLKNVAQDKCPVVCSIETITVPSCRARDCSRTCMTNIRCTAFCLHQPQQPGAPCTCELQAIPGYPVADILMRSEIGAAFWKLC